MASALTSKTFPGFSNTYALEEGRTGGAFRGDIALDDPRAVTRGEKTPREPVEVRWMMGRQRPFDIIHTGYVEPLLVSDRVIGILKANGFSGWRTYAIDLLGKDGRRIPGYHGLAVHGRCGPIDDSRSIEFKAIYPGGIFPAWRGLYFDPATWDGSDLFMPSDNWGVIIVVEAVKRAFEKAKVTNVTFTPLDAADRPDLRLKKR